MKINILGTGHGTVVNCYNTCFTLEENNEHFLVDCGGGNGILKQLQHLNISINNIRAMFVSHTHTDHILGSLWILRMVARLYLKSDFDKNFYVYGNDEVIHAIIQMSSVVLPSKFTDLFGSKIFFVQVKNEETKYILNKKTTFFDINAAKVKQFGFYMELEDNSIFSFIGDETCNKQTEKYIKNSDWLFADAYMCGREADEYNPIKKHHHSTVKFVAELCERLNIKNVILSHTVDTDLKNRRVSFMNDAKLYYNGNVFVPDDLEIIDISQP